MAFYLRLHRHHHYFENPYSNFPRATGPGRAAAFAARTPAEALLLLFAEDEGVQLPLLAPVEDGRFAPPELRSLERRCCPPT